MKKRAFGATLAAGAVVAAVLTGSALARPAAMAGCGSMGGLVDKQAKTASYSLRLVVGLAEQMYTKAEVAKKHPKDGEVMLGGAPMAMVDGASARHLEVHVCNAMANRPVRSVYPKITVTDLTAHKTVIVPVMMMQGVTGGPADLHYGNNVSLPAGHRFQVVVTVKGERATFRFVGPKGQAMSKGMG